MKLTLEEKPKQNLRKIDKGKSKIEPNRLADNDEGAKKFKRKDQEFKNEGWGLEARVQYPIQQKKREEKGKSARERLGMNDEPRTQSPEK